MILFFKLEGEMKKKKREEEEEQMGESRGRRG